MAIEFPKESIWIGRFIDVLGFEGRLTLQLQLDRKRGRVRGEVEISLQEVDEGMATSGDVTGALDGDQLTLTFHPLKMPASILLSAVIFGLQDGGLGLKGSYQVTAEAYSPLRTGVITASTGRVADRVSLAPSAGSPPAVAQQPVREQEAS